MVFEKYKFKKIDKSFILHFEGYCYTQLTDVQQEINGLVDENRNPKFSDRIIDKIRKINKKL